MALHILRSHLAGNGRVCNSGRACRQTAPGQYSSEAISLRRYVPHLGCKFMDLARGTRPRLVVQICGRCPEILSKMALLLHSLAPGGFDALDLLLDSVLR